MRDNTDKQWRAEVANQDSNLSIKSIHKLNSLSLTNRPVQDPASRLPHPDRGLLRGRVQAVPRRRQVRGRDLLPRGAQEAPPRVS